MATLPKPDIVIFDMDGTTVRHRSPRLLHVMETLDDWAYAIRQIIKWILKKRSKGIVLKKEKLVRKRSPSLLVHRAIHRMRRKSVEQIVQPVPGIYDVLDFLHTCNIPCAIVSNGLGKGYGHDILEKFDLAQYFKVAIFREDIKNSKPHPEPILLALDNLLKDTGTSPLNIWYIGDRHKDITAALAANKESHHTITPIACALNSSIAALENGLGPHHILPSNHDVMVVLESLFPQEAHYSAAADS